MQAPQSNTASVQTSTGFLERPNLLDPSEDISSLSLDRSAASFFASLSAASEALRATEEIQAVKAAKGSGVDDLPLPQSKAASRNGSAGAAELGKTDQRKTDGSLLQPSVRLGEPRLRPRTTPIPFETEELDFEARLETGVETGLGSQAVQDEDGELAAMLDELLRSAVVRKAAAPPAGGAAKIAAQMRDGKMRAPGLDVEGSSEVAGNAGLAHDAGNLLSALTLYSDLLAFPDVLSERHRHYASDLKLLAERSWALIDRLTAFGEAPVADAGLVSVVDTLMECQGLLSTMAQGRLEVKFGSQAALPVRIAGESLERILVNLVKNAALATEQGGAIRIRVGVPQAAGPKLVPMDPPQARLAELPESRRARTPSRRRAARPGMAPEAPPRLMLTVDDSGCGMSDAQIEAILHPESAAPNERRGIGLRVVREMVATSGGTLTIQSRPGVGTRIEIAWPTVEPGVIDRMETVAEEETGLRDTRERGIDRALEPARESAGRQYLECFAESEMSGEDAWEAGLTEVERKLLSERTQKAGTLGSNEASGIANAKGAIAC